MGDINFMNEFERGRERESVCVCSCMSKEHCELKKIRKKISFWKRIFKLKKGTCPFHIQ